MQANIISKPNSHTYKWSITIMSGLFMFLVLYVYRAYHIDQVPAFTGHSMLFRALTHSIIISITFYILEFFVSRLLPVNEKLKPLLTALIATFIGLNLTFLAFNFFFHWTEFSWSSYSKFLYEYPLILAFPIILSLLISQLSGNSATTDKLILISSDNQKEHFQIKTEHLLFIKSADNYIEIFHRTNGQVKKHLLRKNLKDLEEQYRHSPFLVRCHRSYLINPANLDHINRSNNKFEVGVAGTAIPVSKKYAASITKKLSPSLIPHIEISSQIP